MRDSGSSFESVSVVSSRVRESFGHARPFLSIHAQRQPNPELAPSKRVMGCRVGTPISCPDKTDPRGASLPQERFLVYRNTATHGYPVVLVFGREGNNEGHLNDIVGQYDWGKSPNSAFWNRAYGFFARTSGAGSAAALKRLCDERDGSPIIFANCSPHLILNAVAEKNRLRHGKDAEVEGHVRRVFELADEALPGRLKAVVVSVGLDFALYDAAVECVSKECQRRKIPLIDAPYFGSRLGNDALDAQFGQRHKDLLAGLVQEFLSR